MTYTRTLAVLTAALVTVPAAGRAQTPDVLREGIKRTVQVTAMDLDVVATKDGKPVSDLTKEEFVVRVDGKELPLDYFTRVTSGTLHGPDLSTASPDLILETQRSDAGDRYLPRQFLVYVDDEHMQVTERKRVLEGLRDFIARLSPSDRVSFLAHSSSTRINVPFTNSKETLLDAIGKLEKIAPAGQRWAMDFRSTIVDAQRSPRSRNTILHNWSQQVYVREKATLEDLRRSVSALAARPGKRVFLYLSNGVEMRPGQSLQQALNASSLSQFDYSVVPEVQQVIAEANRAGVTIHALDARGLVAEGADAAESSEVALSPFDYFFANENRKEVLSLLANETGGAFVSNRNTFNAGMDQIYRESSTYYSIGVTLTNVDPKVKEHKVAVRTTRPGVDVRTRRSYAEKPAEERTRDVTEMALLNPDAQGDFAIGLTVGPPAKGGGMGRRMAQYEIAVPISSLTFLDEGGKKKAVVDFALASIGDDGSKSGIGSERQTIALDPEAWTRGQKESFRYRGELKTGKGNFRFVATVRDVNADRSGIASQSVHVE